MQSYGDFRQIWWIPDNLSSRWGSNAIFFAIYFAESKYLLIFASKIRIFVHREIYIDSCFQFFQPTVRCDKYNKRLIDCVGLHLESLLCLQFSLIKQLCDTILLLRRRFVADSCPCRHNLSRKSGKYFSISQNRRTFASSIRQNDIN